jgi:hypothetical protein
MHDLAVQYIPEIDKKAMAMIDWKKAAQRAKEWKAKNGKPEVKK